MGANRDDRIRARAFELWQQEGSLMAAASAIGCRRRRRSTTKKRPQGTPPT